MDQHPSLSAIVHIFRVLHLIQSSHISLPLPHSAGPSALLHRPIKVPTIVSPTPMTGRMGSRHKTRRSGVGGLSPERPGPSRSPLSSLEER